MCADRRVKAGARPRRISAGKKALFAAVICVGFFLVLEAALWLGGVRTIAQREDPQRGFSGLVKVFQRRGGVYRTRPSRVPQTFNSQSFARRKGSDTVRIFCLGGSSSYGFPWNSKVAFTAILGDVLAAAHRQRRFEPVNASGISYAMHRVRMVAEEILEYEPDIIIIYSGHNEFVERSHYKKLKQRSASRHRVEHALGHLRVYSGARSLIAQFRSGISLESQRPEFYVRRDPTAVYDEHEKRQVVAEYREGLTDLVQQAQARGVKVVLATVPCNLREWAPQLSMLGKKLDGPTFETWRSAVAAGFDDRQRGAYESAAANLKRALAIAPQHAITRYELAKAYEGLEAWDAARQAYEGACDDDMSPIRRLSAINDAVRAVADEQGALLVDIEELFQQRSEHGLIGLNLIEDYVHPTLAGHELIAWHLWEAMERAGWFGPSAVDRVLFDSVVDQRATGSVPLNAPWFFNQGVVLAHRGLTDRAIEKYRQALNLSPDYVVTHFNLAYLLESKGQTKLAIYHYRRVLALDPNFARIDLSLARALAAGGEFDGAAKHYGRALRRGADAAEAEAGLGRVYQLQGKLGEAIGHLGKAVAMDGELASAHQHLAESLLVVGRVDEAIGSYQRYLQLAPGDAQSRYQLARALLGTGRVEQSLEQLEQVLRSQPDAVAGLSLSARILAVHWGERVRRPQRAVELGQRAAMLTGRRDPVILDVLATAYAAAGRFELAVATAQEAIGLARKAGDEGLARQIAVRLKLFENGQAYRDPAPDAVSRQIPAQRAR